MRTFFTAVVAALVLLAAQVHAASACNWYGTSFPVCTTQSTNWGWENSAVCVGSSVCTAAGQKITTAAASCDWYGTSFPVCTTQSTNWGWENSAACIGSSVCTAAGQKISGGGTSTGASAGTSCGPIGNSLAWGTNGTTSSASYLDFISAWVGFEYTQNRAYQCDGCNVVSALKNTTARPAFYSYFIGYALPDCNVQPTGNNLCTGGAQWIRNNYSYLLSLYSNYAAQSYAADPNRGVLWLLEGDFSQYTASTQSNPLTYAELGKLTSDIINAIKSNAPNAKVGVPHSTWLSNDQTNKYWAAMPLSSIDFVWTTGVGNNNGYFDAGTNSSSYNAATANYAYVSKLTGKRILVDTSFGLSQQSDSWTTASVSALNSRIAEGVFAVNVVQPAGNYQASLATIRPQLSSLCK